MDPQNMAYAGSVFGSFFVLAGIVADIWFIASMYGAMKRIPEASRRFPAWFVWMQLIPLVGLVFAWIMIPFGVPGTLEAYFAGHAEAKQKAKTLFVVGLVAVIALTFALIPGIGFLGMLVYLVCFIVYWANLASFKRKYLPKDGVSQEAVAAEVQAQSVQQGNATENTDNQKQ